MQDITDELRALKSDFPGNEYDKRSRVLEFSTVGDLLDNFSKISEAQFRFFGDFLVETLSYTVSIFYPSSRELMRWSATAKYPWIRETYHEGVLGHVKIDVGDHLKSGIYRAFEISVYDATGKIDGLFVYKEGSNTDDITESQIEVVLNSAPLSYFGLKFNAYEPRKNEKPKLLVTEIAKKRGGERIKQGEMGPDVHHASLVYV